MWYSIFSSTLLRLQKIFLLFVGIANPASASPPPNNTDNNSLGLARKSRRPCRHSDELQYAGRWHTA